MTPETLPKPHLLWAALALLVVLSGLCTVFALVTTALQAWEEQAQKQWPEVTARVESCGMQQGSFGHRQMYQIDCRITFAVGTDQNIANIYSTTVPSPNISQYPPNQIAPFERWVEEHPAGSELVVRYDPADHRKAVLVSNFMPRGGPRTPSNLKLLGVLGGSFLLLLVIALITRPESMRKTSMPQYR